MGRRVIEIYTNGSEFENPHSSYFGKGGYGVVCKFDRNQDCHAFCTEGDQSRQRYELEAVKKALLIAKEIEGPAHVKIYTISWFPIGALTIWLNKWRSNGWISNSGNMIKNRALIVETAALKRNMHQYDKTIQLVHLKHQLNSFTKEADRLAKLALRENGFSVVKAYKSRVRCVF